jgi:hypothetical protein
MQKQSKDLALLLFLIRIIDRSKKYGMGEDYIKGQFDEACHQLDINKKHYGESHDL